jgi:hypothetical protein
MLLLCASNLHATKPRAEPAFVAGYVAILAAQLTGAAEVMGAIRRRASLAALGAP